MKRTELREHIFKMVFGYEFNSDAEMPQQMQLYFEQMDDGEPDPKDVEYIRNKALDVILKTEEIDKLINDNTKGWKTARMNKVDLSILRLAVYEMKWDEEIPESVAINEAVELSKKYSGDEGPSFVNGVLAKLAE
ncbi:transcription antitermination factor NusB [Faecalicatena contorta]|uniref:transcription antitermination factor NusB n=1 Tax=Faecalicatena contorta TaxID=39482 RepID=UPI001F35AAAD|nr:transcription antitermination factor NusB [Faecalicatena contorta]MCF2553711.1 transcription antitermination factor NusB [Faecalicatena contorta]